MTEDKKPFRPTIPASQRQQLYSAILSLIGVLLGIVLTLAGQAASFYLDTDPTAPDPSPPLSTMRSRPRDFPLHHLDVAALTLKALPTSTSGHRRSHQPRRRHRTHRRPLRHLHRHHLQRYHRSSGAVATIGDGEVWIVHDVFVNITNDFDCTGDDATLIVGDGNDADGFVVLADAELQAADTEATGFAAGWQGLIAATQGVYIDEAAGANSFIYAPSGAAETIDYLVSEASGDTSLQERPPSTSSIPGSSEAYAPRAIPQRLRLLRPIATLGRRPGCRGRAAHFSPNDPRALQPRHPGSS